MKKTLVRARTSDELKHEVEQILDDLGVTMSQAIHLFLSQIKLHQGIPFQVVIPTRQTTRTLDNSSQGIGVATFNTVDDLFDDLTH